MTLFAWSPSTNSNTVDLQPCLARACRLLYVLGRHDQLNFPLSDEQRAELDALGVTGVVAEFQVSEGACVLAPRMVAGEVSGEVAPTLFGLSDDYRCSVK